MTNVRCFTTDGVTRAPVTGGGQLAYDSIQLMKFPYIAGVVLAVDTVTPQNSDISLSNNRAVSCMFVQVDPGKSVYYELSNNIDNLRVATANSPILRGDTILAFGPNWAISVLGVDA